MHCRKNRKETVLLGVTLLLLVVVTDVSAQSGGSAHIAPFAPGALTYGQTPLFNWGNGVWDLGEGFPSPDNGGVISASDPSQVASVATAELRPLLPIPDPPPGGWPLVPGDTSLRHFIGEFRTPHTPQTILFSESSFEIVVPAAGFTNSTKRQHIVLLLVTQATSGSVQPGSQRYDPHLYPGDPANCGAWGFPPPGGAQFVNEFSTSADPFYVAAGYIVPRTSFQPLVFSVQRLRELRHAMIKVINTYYFPTGPQPTYSACVTGSSFGGLTTQVALSLWPDEFQSGAAFAYNANHRGVTNDQDMYSFFVGGLGWGNDGGGYSMRSAIDWSIFTRIEGVDFTSLSSLNRAHSLLGSGLPALLRPTTIMVADEDLVAHGQDFMHAFAGTSGHAQSYAGRRSYYHPTRSWNVDVMVVGKNCHGGDARQLAEPYHFPGETTLYSNIDEPVRRMIRAAQVESLHPLPPLTPQEKLQPKSGNLVTLDPSDKVFNRKAARVPPATTSLLVEANAAQHSWHRFGRGTWLGAGESLKVVKLPNDSRASIFVGSADGLVTRYLMDPTVSTLPPQPFEPLVQVATSPYSLGYAVYALDVGDLDNSGGLEVVVAAYRRIFVLRATDLAVLQSYDLPDWEQTEPRRLQIAEFYSGNDSKEIVFRTLHGRIVIMGLNAGGQLVVIGQHGEGGVCDLKVGPAVGPRLSGTQFTNGIWLLSARGHLAGLELNSSATDPNNMGALSVASGLQYGAPWDLEVTGSQIVGLYLFEPEDHRSIRVFDTSLQPVAQFGHLLNPSIILENGEEVQIQTSVPTMGTEPSLAITAQGKYVTLVGDFLGVWDLGSDTAAGMKDLKTFAPAREAAALAVGDVDGDSVDDVVVSTLAGRVVWMKMSELTTYGQALDFERSVRVVNNQLHEHRANAAISATWAFAGITGTQPRLHAIDANGAWWVIDPANGLPVSFGGRPSFVLETNLKNLRGLSYGGIGTSQFGINVSGGNNDKFWAVVDNPVSAVSRIIATSPYLPTNQYYTTWGHTLAPLSAVMWDGFWLFPEGGAAMQDGEQWRVAWWAGGFFANSFPNLVQQLTYSVQGTPNPVSLWSSTQTGTGGPPPGPTVIGGSGAQAGVSLRTSFRPFESFDLQTLRLGRVMPGSTALHPVVCGTGGRVIVLDGANGSIVAQSEDLGFGGMALAIANLDNDPEEEIVFAPAVSPIDAVPPPAGQPPHGGHLRTYVHVLEYAASPARLVRVSSQAIGDPYATHDLHGYGACGIAIADLDFPADGVPEIIVTTLNGELVVFGQTGGQNLTPRFQTIVDGQLGAFGSIVVGDFDPFIHTPPEKPEVYIASSLGIRKFFVP